MTTEPPDPVGALVRLAGPREAVSPDRLQRLRASAHGEWRARVATRRQRLAAARAVGALAAAAVVVLGVRLAMDRRPDALPAPAEVATVERALGAVRVVAAEPAAAAPRMLVTGDRLREGDRLDTSGGGRVVVRLTSGGRVRVDRETRVRWSGATVMALDAGAIYVEATDSGGFALEVQTPFGVARDIGTRFEVRLRDAALVVRVRDGLVRVSRGGESHDVNLRGELTVGADGGIARRTIETSDAEWAWAMTLAKPFALEGRSLRDFLDWVAEETGWQVRFARASDEQQAAKTELHGSIAGLTPEQAVEAVLPVSGVDHVLEDGTLTIQRIASDSTR